MRLRQNLDDGVNGTSGLNAKCLAIRRQYGQKRRLIEKWTATVVPTSSGSRCVKTPGPNG